MFASLSRHRIVAALCVNVGREWQSSRASSRGLADRHRLRTVLPSLSVGGFASPPGGVASRLLPSSIRSVVAMLPLLFARLLWYGEGDGQDRTCACGAGKGEEGASPTVYSPPSGADQTAERATRLTRWSSTLRTWLQAPLSLRWKRHRNGAGGIRRNWPIDSGSRERIAGAMGMSKCGAKQTSVTRATAVCSLLSQPSAKVVVVRQKFQWRSMKKSHPLAC